MYQNTLVTDFNLVDPKLAVDGHTFGYNRAGQPLAFRYGVFIPEPDELTLPDDDGWWKIKATDDGPKWVHCRHRPIARSQLGPLANGRYLESKSGERVIRKGDSFS